MGLAEMYLRGLRQIPSPHTLLYRPLQWRYTIRCDNRAVASLGCHRQCQSSPRRLPPARSSARPKVIMIPLTLITRAPNASVGGGSCAHQTVAAPSRWIRPVRCFPASVASQKPVIISIRRSFCELPAAPAGTAMGFTSLPARPASTSSPVDAFPAFLWVRRHNTHSGCGKIRSDISPLGFLASWHSPSGKASR